MATNHMLLDVVAACQEGTAGIPPNYVDGSSLTLEADAIMPAGVPETSVDQRNIERAGFARGALGPLHTVPGVAQRNVKLGVELRYVNSGWTAKATNALLEACGLTVSGSGEHTYTLTAPGSFKAATLELEAGTQWTQVPGCMGNVVITASSGQALKADFDMIGVDRGWEEDAIKGSTITYLGAAPIMCDDMLLTFSAGSNSEAAFSAPVVSGDVVLNLGNKTSLRALSNLARSHGYKYYAVTGGTAATHHSSGTFTDRTQEALDTTAGDIEFDETSNTIGADDSIYMLERTRPWGVEVVLGTAGAGTFTIDLEYWNGSAYTAMSPALEQIVTFKETAGRYFIMWGPPPADWAKATVNSIANVYPLRWRCTAFTSASTQPLVSEIYPLYPGAGIAGWIEDRDITLAMNVEMEAASTFDPFRDWENKSSRDITYVVGGASGNSMQLTLQDCKLTKQPEVVRDGGLVKWALSYRPDHAHATPLSLLLT